MSQTDTTPVFINNRYKVEKKLGEGGMGAVYKVSDTQRNSKILALKIMKKVGGQNEAEYHNLFKKEFEVLAGLNHPHVAQAYDYGPISDGSGFFFTSEFVQGINLLEGTKNVGIENLLEVTVQACRALDYVHSRGLVHHDLKTDNILLTEPEAVSLTGGETPEARRVRGEISDFENYLGELMIDKRIVKIIDFGLIMGEREETSRLSGTPQYMPPEKIRGERCGKRGDLYSLGVVFYLIFTRRLPFVAPRMKELFDKIRDEKPVPPREIQSEIPPAVENMILRLLSKNPEDRYSTAGEIIADLNKQMHRDYSVETETSTEGYISSGRFVGRKRETSTVFNSVEAIFKGYDPTGTEERFYNVFLVAGERGIGKTRFCREMKTGFELRDIFLLDIEPHRFRTNMPLFIRELLSRLEVTPGFVTYTDQGKYHTAKEYADMEAGVEIPDEVIDYLAQAVILCSGIQPIGMICGNLGDANPSFIRFAVSLANIMMKTRTLNAKNLATADTQYKIVAVFEFPAQNHPGSRTGMFGDEFSKDDKFHTIVLDRMEFNEITTLIASMFGQGYIPKGFAEGLFAATGGNPRYVFEVLKDLASKMKISKTGKSWQFEKNIGKIDIPPSYKEEITHGLANIDAESETLLNILATIRERIPLSMIETISGFNKDTLDFKLSVLEKRKIVVKELEDNSFLYRLSFDFMYDIIQDRIAPDLKEGLNRQLGELFESEVTADNRGRLSIQLAQIFLNAGDIDRSVGYALKAVETMAEEKQYEQLRGIFEQLLPQFTDKDYVSFIKAGSKLAEIYEITGLLNSAVNLYKQILEKGAVVLRGWNKALIFRKIAHLLMSQGEHTEAMKMLDEGKSFILEDEESLQSGLFFSSFALAEYKLGNFEESNSFCKKAEQLILEKGDGTDKLKREILNDKLIDAGILLYRGELAESRKLFRELLAEAQYLKFDAAEGMIRNHLGVIYTEKGDFNRAQEELLAAQQIFRERADEISLQEVQLNICQGLIYQNRYMECLEHVEKILLTAVGTEGFESISGKAYLLLGALNRYFGRHSHAKHNFRTSLDLFQKCQNAYLSCAAVLELAETFTDLNNPLEAEKYLSTVDSVIRERGYGGLPVRVETIRGIIALKKGDHETAGSCFQRVEELNGVSEFDYRNMLCRANRIFVESILCPQRLNTSILGDIQVSEFYDLPVFKGYLNFALGIQANLTESREEAWDKIYQAQAVALKFHFMELLWISNFELNKLHVLKTGSVTNRFVNAARRYLEKIIKNLDPEDQDLYRANSLISTSSIFVVDTSKDGPDAQRNLGGIWGQQTVVGGGAGPAQTQMMVKTPGPARGAKDSSSGFIQEGIEKDLKQPKPNEGPPLRLDRDSEVFSQNTVVGSEDVPTQVSVEHSDGLQDITIDEFGPEIVTPSPQVQDITIDQPVPPPVPPVSDVPPAVQETAADLTDFEEPGTDAVSLLPPSTDLPTINVPMPDPGSSEAALESLSAQEQGGDTLMDGGGAVFSEPEEKEQDIFTDRIVPPPPPGAEPEIETPQKATGIAFNINVPTGVQKGVLPEPVPYEDKRPVPQSADAVIEQSYPGSEETVSDPALEEPRFVPPPPPPPVKDPSMQQTFPEAPPVPGTVFQDSKPLPPPPPPGPAEQSQASPPPPLPPGQQTDQTFDWDSMKLEDIDNKKDADE